MKPAVALLMRIAENAYTRFFGSDPAMHTIPDLLTHYEREYARVDAATREVMACLFLPCTWRYCGFPRVVVGHKLAASLMCTAVSADVAAALTMPWPTWILDVPTDTLRHPVSGRPLAFLLVSNALTGAVSVEAHSEHHEDEIIYLSGDSFADVASVRHPDAPALTMAARFVLGAVIELMRHRPSPVVLDGPAPLKQKGARGDVVPATFVVARDVDVDCRAHVGAFLRGERRGPLTVRRLVRGHWKMQPHGPGSTARKLIHVEPYWQGEVGAPMPLRAHQLFEDGDE